MSVLDSEASARTWADFLAKMLSPETRRRLSQMLAAQTEPYLRTEAEELHAAIEKAKTAVDDTRNETVRVTLNGYYLTMHKDDRQPKR